MAVPFFAPSRRKGEFFLFDSPGPPRPRTPGYFCLVTKVPKNTPGPRSWTPFRHCAVRNTLFFDLFCARTLVWFALNRTVFPLCRAKRLFEPGFWESSNLLGRGASVVLVDIDTLVFYGDGCAPIPAAAPQRNLPIESVVSRRSPAHQRRHQNRTTKVASEGKNK